MPERPAPGRPRPVADPVVVALGERADDVARRWVVALVESRPLAEAAELPLAELAAGGPSLCRAILDAVASDRALDALTARADDFARLAGPGGPAAVAAAEALRRAVLEAADAELPRADADVLAHLSDRLAHACAHLAAAAIDRRSQARPARDEAQAEAEAGEAQALPRDAALGEAGAAPVELFSRRPAEAAAPPLWRAALDRRLSDGGRFALLLVELDGAERLRLAEGEDAARELFGRTGRAVRGALRRPDLLAHEDDGRMWVIAPDAGRPGAAALADRVADAVEGAASARGVPLTASVGLAVFPDDGRDAEALTGRAEEWALAARAAGVRVGGGPPERPAADGPRLVP